MGQAIVNGVLLGGLYAAVALGLSLVFGVLRLVNLAHGELMMCGAYLTFLLTEDVGVGLDPLLTLVIVGPAVFAAAYAVQRVVLTPLLRHGMEPPLVATFGLAIVLQALLIEAFSGNSRALSASYETSGVDLLGVNVRAIYLIAFAIGLAMVAATSIVLRRTSFGRALRAAATDPDTAATMGVDVNHLYAVALGVGAVMAAIGGVLVGVAFSITPTAGTAYLIKGFAVVVLGGLGSIGGTLAGGIVIGLTESVGAELFGGSYRDLIVFSLLVVILAVKPTGFFGRAEVTA